MSQTRQELLDSYELDEDNDCIECGFHTVDFHGNHAPEKHRFDCPYRLRVTAKP